MRILFISHYFPPEGNAPASRVQGMCKQWVKDGQEVTVITSVPNCPDGVVYEGYKNKLKQQEVIKGINVIRVWTYIAANKGFVRRILNYVTFMFSAVWAGMFVKKPDVIIATSPQFFCGWAGVLLKTIRRVPFILEIRDIWPEAIVAVGAINNKRIIRLLERLEKMMYACAGHIVTVGQSYKRQLSKRGVDPAKIAIVSNGVDTELFYPQPADEGIRAKYNLKRNFVCAYVGTLGMASGLNVVVEVGRILKERGLSNIRLMLIGDGAIGKQLEREVRKQHLDNIIFTGRKTKELMPRYLASVDACLVHLKKTELFKSVLPTKMFEAGAMARPIILGVQGSAAEWLGDAEGGIAIEPENAEELVDAMVTLAKDDVLREEYGRSGHEYVCAYYDRAVLARSYLEQIRLILAGRSVAVTKDVVQGAQKLRHSQIRTAKSLVSTEG